jgi:NADH:ubiquinone oxidoreductase subunit H
MIARALAAAVLVAALSGCGGPDGLAAEPRELVFTPARTRLELRLYNHGDVPIALSRNRIDPRDRDWGAFTIVDRTLPREVAAGDAAVLHLVVDGDHFEKRGQSRAGQARLHLLVDGTPRSIDLKFTPGDPAQSLRGALLRFAILAAVAGLAWASARRTRRPLPAWPAWLPALVILAVLPWGPGICPDALSQPLSAADVEQCADGRGGAPLVLLPASEALLAYLIALAAAGLGRLAHAVNGGSALAPAVRLASRDLALALAFAGPLLAFGTLSAATLIAEQQIVLLPGIPRWGILVQPLAAVAAIAVAAAPIASKAERLGVAAAIALFFLGGHHLPLVSAGSLPHAAILALAAASLAAKIAATYWLLGRLHGLPQGSRARARLLRVERAGLPLAIIGVLVTSAYALWR